MSLNDEQIALIQQNPLDGSLSRFATWLACLEDSDWRDEVASLLLATADSTVALNLTVSGHVLSGQLFTLRRKVRDESVELSEIQPVADAIVTESSDVVFWAARLTVISSLLEVESPQPNTIKIIPTGFGTPVKMSSGRLDNVENFRAAEQGVFYETDDCVHWTDFPSDRTEGPVWKWLTDLENMELENAPHTLHDNIPTGRTISSFETIPELLETLLDAPRAHQSLYLQGERLHRDISPKSIIITDPAIANGFKGMLIDLDLLKDRDSGASGARHQTGMVQFMAIEILRGIDTTYRHDLESFFYLLLWMCGRTSWEWKSGFRSRNESCPDEDPLRGWEMGVFRELRLSNWVL